MTSKHTQNTKQPDAPGEDELRLAQYKAFIDSLLDRRKPLQKWLNGLKGLRETGITQDRATISNVEGALAEEVEAHKKVKLTDKESLKEFVTNVGAKVIPALEASIKDRRNIDKYFDQSVENLCQMVIDGDLQVGAKMMELLTNIENSHAQELQRLKIQIADQLSTIQDITVEKEALLAGVAVKPREIPNGMVSGKATLQCLICHSVHEVTSGTKMLQCPICSAEIKG